MLITHSEGPEVERIGVIKIKKRKLIQQIGMENLLSVQFVVVFTIGLGYALMLTRTLIVVVKIGIMPRIMKFIFLCL